jgi:hypothetical protein
MGVKEFYKIGALVTVTVGALVGCGGGGDPAPDGGSGADAPGEGRSDATACMPQSDAGDPAVPALEVDGGVALGDLARGLALARCAYVGKCWSLAGYVVNECVQALTEGDGWSFGTCDETNVDILCEVASWSGFSLVGTDLLRAVAAGEIQYDSARAASCLQELAQQACRSPWPVLGAASDCGGVFTCAADAGVPDAGGDAGASAPDAGGDAGASSDGGACAPLAPWAQGPPPPADSCTILDGCSFLAAGASCDSDPPLLGSSLGATPAGQIPKAICAPGLVCQGLSASGGLGTCVPPQDVGGPCVEAFRGAGCMVGLICQCGTCQLAPTTGPCASGYLCKIGEAYCDLDTATCEPVKMIGDDCSQSGVTSCAPNAICQGTCEAPP